MRTSSAGFSVAWEGYSATLYAGLQELQQRSEFVDMTLAADGHLVRVHQVVIGLASPYLKELVRSAPTPHPIIFLNNVSHKVLCCILEYMYTGEVVVPADELAKFVEAGKALHVKGLEDLNIEQPLASTKTAASPDVVEAATTLGRISNINSLSVKSELDLSEFIIEGHSGEKIQQKTVKEAVMQAETPTRKHEYFSQDIPDEIMESPSKMLTFIPIRQTAELVHSPVSQEEHLEESMESSDMIQTNIQDLQEDVFIQDQAQEANDFSLKATPNYKNPHESNQTMKAATEKPEIMYTISNMGGIQMILNRYMYRMRNKYKDGRRRWQCVNYNLTKCPAMAVTLESQVLSRTALHNHAYHDKKIMSKAKNNLVYASLTAADKANVKL